jgi:hypothetical protein
VTCEYVGLEGGEHELSESIHPQTEQNLVNPMSRVQQKYETGISQIQVRRTTATPNCLVVYIVKILITINTRN